MSNEALRPGAEFDAIRAMLDVWGARADGVGDDAALLHPPKGDSIVVSVDACIEGEHFLRGWIPPQAIGYRAVTASLSDLAAMAGRADAVLLSLVVPEGWHEHLLMIAQGAGEAAAAVGARIVGGNLSRGDMLGITTTVVGSVWAPGALRRDGARIGDRVYVTGRLGACGAAVDALYAGEPVPGDRLARFAHPCARVAEARWLACRGATAATDISDGLLADLRNIEAASDVAVRLDEARVPLWPGVRRERALTSGEEYELLVTAGQGQLDIEDFKARFGIPLTEIGVVESRRREHRELQPRDGFDHFSV